MSHFITNNNIPEIFYETTNTLLEWHLLTPEMLHSYSIAKIAKITTKVAIGKEFRTCLTEFYQSLDQFLSQNDPTRMTALLHRHIVRFDPIKQSDNEKLTQLIKLFRTNRSDLFLTPASDYIRESNRPISINKIEIAKESCKQLSVEFQDLQDEIKLLHAGVLKFETENTKGVIDPSYPFSIQLQLFFFLRPLLKNAESISRFARTYDAGLKNAVSDFDQFRERLSSKNDYEIYKGHKTFVYRMREFLDWSIQETEIVANQLSLLGKTYDYLGRPNVLKDLLNLELLSKKAPNQFPFKDSLRKQIENHSENKTLNTRQIVLLEKNMRHQLRMLKTHILDCLKRAEHWLPELKVEKPQAQIAPRVQSKVKPEPASGKEEEEVPLTAPVETIQKAPEPVKSSIELLQEFRKKLGHSSSENPSTNEKVAYWHLHSLLVRLTDLKTAPKTTQELLGFITGLVQDGTLAIEQLLTNTLLQNNTISKEELSHNLVDLLYRTKDEIPHKIRKNIFAFNRGEILTRHLPRCKSTGNQVEKLLADLYQKKSPSELICQTLSYTKELAATFLHLSGHPRAGTLLPLFEKALAELESNSKTIAWEPENGAKKTPLEEMQETLVKKFSNVPFEKTQEDLANLEMNFLQRLRAVQDRLSLLQPISAPLVLSDSRLLTQMGAEALFYLLLDLRGTKYDKKEIDHDLSLQIKKLNIKDSVFTDKEKLFLKKGKKIRYEMRYPNDREKDLKDARELADRHLLEATPFIEEGFQLVGKDQSILTRIKKLAKDEINLFISICSKVLTQVKIQDFS